MDSGFAVFCRVKFQVIWAYLASFAAVIRGALRDEIKRIEDKGAFH